MTRPAVLAAAAPGLRGAIRRAYGLRKTPGPDRVVRIAEAWRPYRTLACFCLWGSLERPVRPSRSGCRAPSRRRRGASRSSRARRTGHAP